MTTPNNRFETPRGGIDIIAVYGLDPQSFKHHIGDRYSKGVEHFHVNVKATNAIIDQNRNRFYREMVEKFGADSEQAEHTLRENEAARMAPPKPEWQELTGLTRQNLPYLSPAQRRRGFTILVNAATHMTRWELKHGTAWGPLDESPINMAGTANMDTAPGLLQTVERSIFWDPLNEICAAMGIARPMLSRFSVELQGKNANEIVDTLKVADIRTKMRDVLFPTLRELSGLAQDTSAAKAIDVVKAFIAEAEKGRPSRRPLFMKKGAEAERMLLARKLWNLLKASRQAPEFDRTAYAQSFGIPTHHRLHRACLIEFRKTPGQIELEVIIEFLKRCEEVSASEGSQPSQEATPSPAVLEESKKEVESQEAAAEAPASPQQVHFPTSELPDSEGHENVA